MSLSELRDAVRAGNAELGRSGLVVLSFGNLSAVDRMAGVVAIKPSGVGYADLRPDDIPIVDVVTGDTVMGASRPSSDLPTHLELYGAFGSIGAIVHTHSAHATAWAQARREIPCLGTTHADHFRGAIPVTRPLTAAEIGADYERNTGRVIVEAFEAGGSSPEDIPAVLVTGHGPFAWGPSIEAALANAIALEQVAAIALHQSRIGSLEPLPAALSERHFNRKHGPDAYYGQASARPPAPHREGRAMPALGVKK
jgi:L-ribulose-5-phosphate 4-epimerase